MLNVNEIVAVIDSYEQTDWTVLDNLENILATCEVDNG